MKRSLNVARRVADKETAGPTGLVYGGIVTALIVLFQYGHSLLNVSAYFHSYNNYFLRQQVCIPPPPPPTCV